MSALNIGRRINRASGGGQIVDHARIGQLGVMNAHPITKFKEDRPGLSPGEAANRLVELIQAEMKARDNPHAYTGTLNSAFQRSGGTIAEYGAGRDYGIEAGLFTIDDSGSRVKLGRHGIGWKRPSEMAGNDARG